MDQERRSPMPPTGPPPKPRSSRSSTLRSFAFSTARRSKRSTEIESGLTSSNPMYAKESGDFDRNASLSEVSFSDARKHDSTPEIRELDIQEPKYTPNKDDYGLAEIEDYYVEDEKAVKKKKKREGKNKPKATSRDKNQRILDSIEDLDYDLEHDRIQNLPFVERIWAKKLPQRMIIASIAVVLLWLTSLILVSYIILDLMFVKPNFGDVVTRVNRLFNESDQQQNEFTETQTRLLESCQEISNVSHREQVDFVKGNISKNDVDIEDFTTKRLDARIILDAILNDITSRNELEVFTLLSDPDNVEQCSRAIQFANERLAAAVAQGAYGDFSGDTKDLVNDMIALQEDIDAYDKQFYDEKALEDAQRRIDSAAAYQQAVNDYNTAMSEDFEAYSSCLTSSTCSLGVNGLGGTLDESAADFEQKFQNAQREFDKISSELTEAFNEYNNFINRPEVQGVFALSGQNVGEEDQNDVSFIPEIDLTELNQRASDAAQGVSNNMGAAVDAVKDAATTSAQQFKENLDDNVDITQPPVPSINRQPQTDFEANQAIRDEQFNKSITKLNQGNDDEFLPPSERESEFPVSEDNLVSPLKERQFDFFSYPSDLFNDINIGLEYAFDLAIYADIAFRVIQTVLIFNKYWRMSSIGKPPGDARVHIMNGKAFGLKASPQQKMADRLSSPTFINSILIIVVVIVTSVIWFLYKPFFDGYVDGCVRNDFNDVAAGTINGTFIVRNMLALSFNRAAEEGDAILSSGVQALNVEIELNCIENRDNSSEIFNNHAAQFDALSVDFAEAKTLRDEIENCFDLTKLSDTTQITINDGVFREEFTPPSLGAVYNCSAVESCVVEENIPDRITLVEASWETGCTLELWIQSSLLSFVVVIFTYILLNLFRKQFMRALVRLWWRNLNPFDFNFIGTCTRNGHPIDPEEVTQDAFTFQDAIAIAVYKALKSWEKQGWINMGLAFSLNIPWIAMGVFLSSSINNEQLTGAL